MTSPNKPATPANASSDAGASADTSQIQQKERGTGHGCFWLGVITVGVFVLLIVLGMLLRHK